MFGDGGPFARSFVQPMIHSIQNSLPLKLFADEFRTPAYAVSAARGILMLLESAYSGVIHLGGKERISRYEFGKKVANHLGIDAGIEPVLLSTSTMAAPRPVDVSLDSSKAYALGYAPLSIDEALTEILG